jgi:hypothetical protein
MKNRSTIVITLCLCLAAFSSFAVSKQVAGQATSAARAENTFEAVPEAAFKKALEGRTAATSHSTLTTLRGASETYGFTAVMTVSWVNLPDFSKFNDAFIEVQPLDSSGNPVGAMLFCKVKILAPTKRRLQLPLPDPLNTQIIKGAHVRVLPPGEDVFVSWRTTFRPQF